MATTATTTKMTTTSADPEPFQAQDAESFESGSTSIVERIHARRWGADCPSAIVSRQSTAAVSGEGDNYVSNS